VRVLAIAPGSDPGALRVLREALGAAIDEGEVEWLDPIAGPDVGAKLLFDRLRSGKRPHVVHWLGHGGLDPSKRPVLRLADDPDRDEQDGQVWVLAEDIARELSAGFKNDLRLIVLESCQGAAPGVLGSAAEIFSRAGADAVVAHLWPVMADAARACSTTFYRALTRAEHEKGDVAAGVAAARRTVLVDRDSAEAFSPVLFLRRPESVLFGERIVTRSLDIEKAVQVWNADGQGDPIVLKGHMALSAAWSPDGKRIVTASVDKTARIWLSTSPPSSNSSATPPPTA
jgi:hypothetical protein